VRKEVVGRDGICCTGQHWRFYRDRPQSCPGTVSLIAEVDQQGIVEKQKDDERIRRTHRRRRV
jgi:hypothetical protein